MYSIRKILLSIFWCVAWLVLPAQEERGLVRTGNQRYIEGKYDEAEKEYSKALGIQNSLPEGVFNMGDVAYQKQDFQKAKDQFDTAIMLMKDDKEKAKAYHNLGNVCLKMQKYEESIAAYKDALRLNPADMDTKYNLAYAQQMLKKQQQQGQQNKDNKDEDKKDNENKDNKQDQNQQNKNQDQKQEQQKKEDEQKQAEKSKEEQAKEQQAEKKEGQQEQPKQAQISKEQAERLLKSLTQEEQKVQQQLIIKKLPPVQKKTTDKDW